MVIVGVSVADTITLVISANDKHKQSNKSLITQRHFIIGLYQASYQVKSLLITPIHSDICPSEYLLLSDQVELPKLCYATGRVDYSIAFTVVISIS